MRLDFTLPKQAGPMSPLGNLLGRLCECSPLSSTCQPNLGASWRAVPSSAVWCISFLGMQPTFTHVPPRPRHQSRTSSATRQHSFQFNSLSNRVSLVSPQVVPLGVGTTKSSTMTFFPSEAASYSQQMWSEFVSNMDERISEVLWTKSWRWQGNYSVRFKLTSNHRVAQHGNVVRQLCYLRASKASGSSPNNDQVVFVLFTLAAQ